MDRIAFYTLERPGIIALVFFVLAAVAALLESWIRENMAMSTRKPATTYIDISEVNFQSQIVKLAKLRGWKVYHTYDSPKISRGIPGPDSDSG